MTNLIILAAAALLVAAFFKRGVGSFSSTLPKDAYLGESGGTNLKWRDEKMEA